MTPSPDQTRSGGRRTGLILVVIAMAASLALVGCGKNGDGTPSGTDALEGLTRDQPLDLGDRALPQVHADGTTTPFTLHAPKGGLLFLAFGYTNCPDVCPTTLSDIRKALKKMGPEDAKRVEVAFATVDPERDTADVMSQYLGSFVDDGHPLRAEDPTELHAVQDVLGITSEVVKQPDGTVDVAHTARSFVIDDQGRVAVEWTFGTTYEAMASDLQILLNRDQTT